MGQCDKRKAVLRQAQDSPERSRRADLYKWIKIAGLLSFLPFVLGAGPIAGFYLGSYLEHRFGLSAYVSIALVTVGFVASLRETVRIVKIALRAQEKA